MTFSICVRERYRDDAGEEQTRYGVAVTTRLPAVGTLCPFVSAHGAVATQAYVNVELGRRGIEYLADGVGVDDALEGLLNADEEQSRRQVHGVDDSTEFAFSGEDCKPWFGDEIGSNYTVAGNLLTGEAVLAETASAYEAQSSEDVDTTADSPLAERLIDALAAGHAEGGDKRDELPIQSAALAVETTEERAEEPLYEDLRVDATETPIEDLRETFELARDGYEMALEREAEE